MKKDFITCENIFGGQADHVLEPGNGTWEDMTPIGQRSSAKALSQLQY
jgi:hypothetical protein